jgi:REP element-mobilizing transposase RayT
MEEDPVWLTLEQGKVVEEAVRDVARRYDWTIHAMASQSDHTHVVITACRKGRELRDALKACATRALNKTFGKRTWWSECGSARYLWEQPYFENSVSYVREQREF